MQKHSILFTLFFSILTIAFLSSCQSNEKEVLQNYPSGELSRRHYEVNGKKEGKMVEYYRDGSVKGERMFKDDVQVGVAITYYPGGAVKERQYYSDEGMKTGGDTLFYENGKPQFMRNWDKNKLHGYIRKWGEDGTLIYEARYDHDNLVEVKGEAIEQDSLKRHTLDTIKMN